MIELNAGGLASCQSLLENPDDFAVSVHASQQSATIIDCGVDVPGSTAAGLLMADVCLAGLADVQSLSPVDAASSWPSVAVACEQPLAACMASQYAGWQISHEDYFAMASGPMRAAYGGEELFDHIGFRERPERVIGVLEASHLPGPDVCQLVADKCGVAAEQLTLLVAPTASLAGICQVVARALETALHKMHQLGIDLALIERGEGSAPLLPPGKDDLVALGLSNDAVLYGGDVCIWIGLDDDQIQDQGPAIPSCSSSDYGRPFQQVFKQYDHDFYKIDPLLFSPARITLVSTLSGNRMTFGQLAPDVLQSSLAASITDS